MKTARRLLFVGGGTVGHIAPLVAVVQAMHEQDASAQLYYAGSAADCASNALDPVRPYIQLVKVPAGKLHRHLTWKQVGETGRILGGLVVALWLLITIRPTQLFLKGGAASVPFALWGGLLRIPIITHETDVAAGLANKISAKVAKIICTAFPISFYADLPSERAIYTGQPVRDFFYEKRTDWPLEGEFERDPTLPLLVVTGGSQGARTLNQIVADALPSLLGKMQVVVQTGKLDYAGMGERVAGLPKALRQNLYIAPFVTGEILAALFTQADVVITRSGGTIFELAASKSASILIPLPTAAQDHQRKNARQLEKVGAAIVLQQSGLTGEMLREAVELILEDAELRDGLTEKIAQFAKSDAARQVAKQLLS